MKIKSLVYVLMGTMLVTTACSDNELEKGNDGPGTVDPVNASPLVKVYADEKGENLLAEDVFVKDGSSRTITLNVPIHADKVYMEYNTVSGEVKKASFALSPVTRSESYPTDFSYETTHNASVTLSLPEDAVKPTAEPTADYLFYHSTGVAMFEDGWPKESTWYDEDFNDVVFEYDIKVSECQNEELMEIQGSKEELLLTLDVRAVGGQIPTQLGVVLENLKSEYVDRITAKLSLKGGQGTERLLKQVQLSTESEVSIEARDWRWDQDDADKKRYAGLSVNTTPEEGTVIKLDGLSGLHSDLLDGTPRAYFQTTKGAIREGLPMLRAEVRLIGKDGLKGQDRENQLKAFRDLILDTQRQNFFIVVNGGKEIHMRGYKPTSAYADYAKDAATMSGNEAINENIPYCNMNGFVWGIKVPVGTRHAYEKVAFETAYPKFKDWAKNNGASYKNWYEDFEPEETVKYW